MESRCQVIEIKGNTVRLAGYSGRLDDTGELRRQLDQFQLFRPKPGQIGLWQRHSSLLSAPSER